MSDKSESPKQDRPIRDVHIVRFGDGSLRKTEDQVAVEEPLEIRVVFGPKDKRKSKSLSITMRTPGHDFELAAGFLLSENVIQTGNQIESMAHVGPSPDQHSEGHGNTLLVELSPSVDFSTEQLQRHFYMTSSCGVCGKSSIDAVMSQGYQELKTVIQVPAEIITCLPDRLRTQQETFDSTGGIHAAGLFGSEGNLNSIREDVGRHNAVDKLVGNELLQSPNRTPAKRKILVVSGRASFELVQKALTASFEMLVAVGAPSSLAIDLAKSFNLTLIGFASRQKFNVYSGFERVRFHETKDS
jgi:FdhD protein